METTESAQHAQSRAHQPPRNRRPPSTQPRCWETPAQFGAPSALAGSRRLPPAAEPRSEVFWRPWLGVPGEKDQPAPCHKAQVMPSGPGMPEASGKLSQYRHPVRLLWPKSKCYDYLYQEAQTLLKNFPIQATISFYEESDSEDEFEELPCENQPN